MTGIQQRPVRLSEHILAILLALVTAGLYAPASLWLMEQTRQHEQLLHAFLVLGFTGVLLVTEKRRKLKLYLAFDNRATIGLALSFAVMSAAWILHFPLLALAAYCLALYAWVIYFFGPRAGQVARALNTAFICFIVVVLLFNFLDWPLRNMAGKYSAWLLDLCGFHTELMLHQGEVSQLVMMVNGRPFEVASECNGFGMIAGSGLMALLLSVYDRLAWFDRILSICVAFFAASLFNTLRIFIICLLAPSVGDHYHLMHETVGSIFFWGCLALVWKLTRGLPHKDSPVKAPGKNAVPS